jgi:hypothetical protein
MPERGRRRVTDAEFREQLTALRAERRRRVEAMLHRDVVRQSPGNAIYWIAVVGGAFLLNLGLLLVVAR